MSHKLCTFLVLSTMCGRCVTTYFPHYMNTAVVCTVLYLFGFVLITAQYLIYCYFVNRLKSSTYFKSS